jgi:hypothetical protein
MLLFSLLCPKVISTFTLTSGVPLTKEKASFYLTKLEAEGAVNT